jgi:hypothetical protein
MTDLPGVPATDKEKERISMGGRASERAPVVRIDEIPVSPEEEKAREEGYLERVEKEVELKKPVVHRGQVLVTAPSAQKPKIVLPVSKQTYLNPQNWHLPVTAALRWLLTWIKRVMKISPEGTVFQDESVTRP